MTYNLKHGGVMNYEYDHKVVNDMDKPYGRSYKIIIVYIFIVLSLLVTASIKNQRHSTLDCYFYINLISIALIAWGIRKSCCIKNNDSHLILFRAGLFCLVNSSLCSTAGGLNVIEREEAALFAGIIYIPAIALIIIAANKFVHQCNLQYRSALDLSLTDELTGLPNRRALNMKLVELEQNSGTICICDIDHFKKINDMYGHVAGDKVLIEIGKILKKLSNEKMFIARSGGEEFCIILNNSAKNNVVFENIKKEVTMQMKPDINITLSMGVAIKPKDKSSALIINEADLALYKAKRSGRDTIMYADSDHS